MIFINFDEGQTFQPLNFLLLSYFRLSLNMIMKSSKYYRVGAIATDAISVQLVCMGIVPGKVIQVIRRAPLGGAYYISCDNKRIGISASELKGLALTEVTNKEEKAL